MPPSLYTATEREKIVQGYQKLDGLTDLLGEYDDDVVNAFIRQHGVYFTNSMLCFGGSEDLSDHPRRYVECCRPLILRQIEVAPRPSQRLRAPALDCSAAGARPGGTGGENTGNALLRASPAPP